MAKTTPTYDETLALLRAPFRPAVATCDIYAFGDCIKTGARIVAKPYHNDPDGYVSIRFTDSAGARHEFTETDDRVAYI